MFQVNSVKALLGRARSRVSTSIQYSRHTLKNGSIILQGPHHVAKKSTTTNLSPAWESFWRRSAFSVITGKGKGTRRASLQQPHMTAWNTRLSFYKLIEMPFFAIKAKPAFWDQCALIDRKYGVSEPNKLLYLLDNWLIFWGPLCSLRRSERPKTVVGTDRPRSSTTLETWKHQTCFPQTKFVKEKHSPWSTMQSSPL